MSVMLSGRDCHQEIVSVGSQSAGGNISRIHLSQVIVRHPVGLDYQLAVSVRFPSPMRRSISRLLYEIHQIRSPMVAPYRMQRRRKQLARIVC